jgi:Bacterial protein of unknown function (DUF899)
MVAIREEWLAARKALLAREKEHPRMGDDLARQRCELRWVRVEKEYGFEADDGGPNANLASTAKCLTTTCALCQPIRTLFPVTKPYRPPCVFWGALGAKSRSSVTIVGNSCMGASTSMAQNAPFAVPP